MRDGCEGAFAHPDFPTLQKTRWRTTGSRTILGRECHPHRVRNVMKLAVSELLTTASLRLRDDRFSLDAARNRIPDTRRDYSLHVST